MTLSHPSYLPKTSSKYHHTVGRASTYEFQADTDIKSIVPAPDYLLDVTLGNFPHFSVTQFLYL